MRALGEFALLGTNLTLSSTPIMVFSIWHWLNHDIHQSSFFDRCEREKSSKMRSGKTGWSWQTGSSTPSGKKTRATSGEPGSNPVWKFCPYSFFSFPSTPRFEHQFRISYCLAFWGLSRRNANSRLHHPLLFKIALAEESNLGSFGFRLFSLSKAGPQPVHYPLVVDFSYTIFFNWSAVVAQF